jgi:endo-1,4-beta-xylanase
MRSARVLAILLLGACVCPGVSADKNALKPVGELPKIKELPNPFTFSDGSAVRTKTDWQRRRKELKELFQNYMYGHLPPKPKKMTIKRGDPVTDEDNKVTIQDLELKLQQGDKALTMHLRIALPQGARKPVPVVIQSSFGRFGFGPPEDAGRFFTAFTKRGYAVALCNFQELAPDNKTRARTAGVYKLFGDKIDCGALMAWAWGVHRVIDALEKVDKIDAKKVIVTGHSRYGKAALVAGAFDERIALTVPSHSGCGGAAPYRFIYGKSEQLHNVAGAFPHWFCPDFKQFVGNVERLPVDQHLLIALVAPRALLGTEGTKDTWINPEGAQLTYLAAKKVYDFLKAGDKISIRYRPVGHIPNNNDLMDFADHVFFNKALDKEFGKLPYKEEKKGFTWNIPK